MTNTFSACFQPSQIVSPSLQLGLLFQDARREIPTLTFPFCSCSHSSLFSGFCFFLTLPLPRVFVFQEARERNPSTTEREKHAGQGQKCKRDGLTLPFCSCSRRTC